MGIMWFVLGGLLCLAFWALYRLNGRREEKFTPLVWIMFMITVLQSLFTIAWVVTSIVEGESQAAAMGLLFFGFITLGLAGITRRFVKNNVKQPG